MAHFSKVMGTVRGDQRRSSLHALVHSSLLSASLAFSPALPPGLTLGWPWGNLGLAVLQETLEGDRITTHDERLAEKISPELPFKRSAMKAQPLGYP